MKLSDIMTRVVVTVDLDETLERIKTLFDESKFHHLVVTDDARVVGVISDHDLLRHVSPFIGNQWMERTQDRGTLHRKAHQIMTRHPIVVPADMDVTQATKIVLEKGVGCLPVVGRGMRCVGIVTWRDLLRVCFMCQAPTQQAA
jgi:acetoin utilization protein AcuB